MSDFSEQHEAVSLAQRPNPLLPIFVYGTLMQGQPGFHQLENFSPKVTPARVAGQLVLRDGLPFLDASGHGEVLGQLLAFEDHVQKQALDVICKFEPASLYAWHQIQTLDGDQANALRGLNLDKGGAEPVAGNRWTLDMDPVFREAMAVVQETAGIHATDEFPNDPERVDWQRAFRIQMAYLLLWSVPERFSALAVGPAMNPSKRVTELGKLSGVVKAVRALDAQKRRVFDSRKPSGKPCVLDVRERPEKALTYYYAVRSNLSHRGKSAWKDAETVRLSLKELLQVTSSVLSSMGETT